MREEHLATSTAGSQPLGKRLLVHLHLFVLLLAVLLWVLHLAGILFPDPPELEKAVAGISERLQTVEAALGSPQADLGEERAELTALEGQATAAYGRLTGKGPALDVGLTYAPALLSARREGVSNEIRFPPPKLIEPDEEMGRIVVKWLDDADSNVPIARYRILRRDGAGGGTMKQVAEISGEKKSWSDTDVKIGKSYAYRVVAVTDEPSLDAADRVSQRSAPVTARARADVRLMLLGGDAEKQEARFRVEKWHNESWFSREFSAQAGQLVGKKDTGAGVDFGSGWRIKKISSRDTSETAKVEQVVFDARGHVRVESGRPVVEEVPVTTDYVELTVVVEADGQPDETHTHREKR